MARVFVSIGSNIDRRRHLRGALAALQQRYGALSQSPIYQTPAEGFRGEDFYNMVVEFTTEETAAGVAAVLTAIEDAFGRDRQTPRFSPRSLDLDLLFYGDKVIVDDGLTIPRPEIIRHAFVLRPLAELAPNFIHPQTGQTLECLWREFKGARPAFTPVTL
jgi:2-amino-4-hydroxy-6-hydroxymethyldihydropteridine diphosphokinase